MKGMILDLYESLVLQMMKKTTYWTALLSLISIIPFTTNAQFRDYNITKEGAILEWQGSKLGQVHTGNVSFDGFITDHNGSFIGGEFVIDMNTITNTDIEDDKNNAILVSHLKSEDFFHVEKYPRSRFKIMNAKTSSTIGYTHDIVGQLTIKGKSKSIKIPANIAYFTGGIKVYALFTVNRLDYGIKYRSESLGNAIKDQIISDWITFKLEFYVDMNDLKND